MTRIRFRKQVIRPELLIPSLVVLACWLAGGLWPAADPCQSSDGPQFRCWIEEQA